MTDLGAPLTVPLVSCWMDFEGLPLTLGYVCLIEWGVGSGGPYSKTVNQQAAAQCPTIPIALSL